MSRKAFIPQIWLLFTVTLFILTACSSLRGVGIPPTTSTTSYNPFPTTTPPAASERIRTPTSYSSLPDRELHFEKISVEHGLSYSSACCIVQDAKGYLWIGTDDGLSRYDGYTFTTFRHDPYRSSSLSENHIRSLYLDGRSVLWIGTAGGGLDQFDSLSEQFIHFRHDPSDPFSLSHDQITAIHEDSSGRLWVGTDGGGLNWLDPDRQKFSSYRHDPSDPNSLGDDHVHSIYQDRQGLLWVGTAIDLECLEVGSGRFTSYPDLTAQIGAPAGLLVHAILEDHTGRLWLGTEGGGLLEFNRQEGSFRQFLIDPSDIGGFSYNDVTTLYEDRSQGFWVGTNGGGIYNFDPQTRRLYPYRTDPNHSSSLSSNYVNTVFEDRTGNLWIGTNGGGINKVNRSKEKFQLFQNDPNNYNSLVHNRILTIATSPDGTIWIGTNGKGMDRFDPLTLRFTHFRHQLGDPNSLMGDYVDVVLVDRQGFLWAGVRGEGLERYDPESRLFTHYRHDPKDPDSLNGGTIKTILEDRRGNLWIGTPGNGLDHMDRQSGQFTHFLSDPSNPSSLSSNQISSLLEDRAGSLWVGTFDSGLNRLDTESGHFTHFRFQASNPEGLSSDQINCLFEDSQGNLWIGTQGGGLNRLDPSQGTFTHFNYEDGLPDNVIYGILEDGRGNLWLSTRRGLSRFNLGTGGFRNYGEADGLQSFEFSQGAYAQGLDGQMFFGGINGLNVFYPDQINDNPYIPAIVITAFSKFNRVVQNDLPTGEQIKLTYKDNFISFEFAALDFTAPERNQYAYMLEGLDQDWVYAGSRHHVDYTNIQPGTYTFRVKGSNNDGVWNEVGTAITLTISPPFWGSWWFIGLVTILLMGIGFATYRLRVGNIEAHSHQLEALVEERTHALELRTGELEEKTREIERRRQELEVLYHADEKLYRNLQYDQALQTLVDTAVDILHADKGTLMVWDEAHEKLVARAARGFRPETVADMILAPGEGVAGIVAMTGEPVIIQDASKDPRVSHRITEPEEIHSFMQVPIKVGGKVFGVFSADYIQPRTIGEEELHLLVALAERAALAIQNAQLYERTQTLAAVEERSRLARELHDAVTQTLFSASLVAEALPSTWEKDNSVGRQLLAELRQLSRGALAEMRTLLLELRPSALADTNLQDLLRQLGEAAYGHEGIPVELVVEGGFPLPSDVHIAIYRITQEALNNVVKHARASQAIVHLRYTSETGSSATRQRETVTLVVRDNGRGFDPSKVPPDHLGLRIMQERAQSISANLKVDSQPGRGTQVTVLWEREVTR